MKKKYGNTIWNYLCCSVLFVFTLTYLSLDLLRVKDSNADIIKALPAPTKLLSTSNSKSIERICGLRFDQANPLKFDFIFETPKSEESNEEQRTKLIKYFITALTVPSQDLWVNLSPYENDRILEEALSRTQLGVDMLAQDYILKQLSSSLTYPDTELGKKYWSLGQEKNQFNKVWVSADSAELYVGNNSMILGDTRMKVQSEKDYLAAAANELKENEHDNNPMHEIIEELEWEVNEGEHFVQLRQIYNSIILANSFKTILKNHLLSLAYSNQTKLGGNNNLDEKLKSQIYQQYVKAFEKGVYDFIKTENINGQKAKVRYFSGGAKFNEAKVTSSSLEDYTQPTDMAFYFVRVASQTTEKSAEQLFDYTSWDDSEEHIANQAQGNEFYENTVIANSKLVKPNKSLLLAEYSGSLQADLARCIAVLAVNEKTGQKGLAHIFPAQAEAKIADRWYLEKKPSSEIQKEEKAKVIQERLEIFSGNDWRYAIVGSIDTSNKIDSNSITVSNVLNYLKIEKRVALENIQLDAEEVFKTVVLDQQGNVRIYKDKQDNFAKKIKTNSPDRIINLSSSSLAWGPESFDWVRNVKVLKGNKMPHGSREINFISKDMGALDEVRLAFYNNKKVAVRMSKYHPEHEFHYKGSKRVKDRDIRFNADLVTTIERIKEYHKKTGENPIIENPQARIVLEDGRMALLAELYPRGQTLADFIDGYFIEGSKVTEIKAASIILQVVKAMEWMQGAGVVHGDLHPGNIYLVGNKVGVIDIGEMRPLNESEIEGLSNEFMDRDFSRLKEQVLSQLLAVLPASKSDSFVNLELLIQKLGKDKNISLQDLHTQASETLNELNQASSSLNSKVILGIEMALSVLLAAETPMPLNQLTRWVDVRLADTSEYAQVNRDAAYTDVYEELLLRPLESSLHMLAGYAASDSTTVLNHMAVAYYLANYQEQEQIDVYSGLPEKYQSYLMSEQIEAHLSENSLPELLQALEIYADRAAIELAVQEHNFHAQAPMGYNEAIQELGQAAQYMMDGEYSQAEEKINNVINNSANQVLIESARDLQLELEELKTGSSSLASVAGKSLLLVSLMLGSMLGHAEAGMRINGNEVNYDSKSFTQEESNYPWNQDNRVDETGDTIATEMEEDTAAVSLDPEMYNKKYDEAQIILGELKEAFAAEDYDSVLARIDELDAYVDIVEVLIETQVLKAEIHKQKDDYYQAAGTLLSLADLILDKNHNIDFADIYARDAISLYPSAEMLFWAEEISKRLANLQYSQELSVMAILFESQDTIENQSPEFVRSLEERAIMLIEASPAFQNSDVPVTDAYLNLSLRTNDRMITEKAFARVEELIFSKSNEWLIANFTNVENVLGSQLNYYEFITDKKAKKLAMTKFVGFITSNSLDNDDKYSKLKNSLEDDIKLINEETKAQEENDIYGGVDFSLTGLQIIEMQDKFELAPVDRKLLHAFQTAPGLSFKILNTRKVDNVKQELLFN